MQFVSQRGRKRHSRPSCSFSSHVPWRPRDRRSSCFECALSSNHTDNSSPSKWIVVLVFLKGTEGSCGIKINHTELMYAPSFGNYKTWYIWKQVPEVLTHKYEGMSVKYQGMAYCSQVLTYSARGVRYTEIQCTSCSAPCFICVSHVFY